MFLVSSTVFWTEKYSISPKLYDDHQCSTVYLGGYFPPVVGFCIVQPSVCWWYIPFSERTCSVTIFSPDYLWISKCCMKHFGKRGREVGYRHGQVSLINGPCSLDSLYFSYLWRMLSLTSSSLFVSFTASCPAGKDGNQLLIRASTFCIYSHRSNCSVLFPCSVLRMMNTAMLGSGVEEANMAAWVLTVADGRKVSFRFRWAVILSGVFFIIEFILIVWLEKSVLVLTYHVLESSCF